MLVPTTDLYLSYWHWIASVDFCGYDFGKVLINGSVVESYDLCDANNTSGWVQRVVNLSAYSGQSVALQIRAECDFSYNSNLFIDQVAFQSTPRAENPAPESIIDLGASLLKSDVVSK